MGKVKCAVLGLGIGAVHLRNLAKISDAELVAVADLNMDLARKAAEQAGARAYGDLGALLDGEQELDAVIVATPAMVRRQPIEAICARRVALFCEKPPALNSIEAQAISDIIARAGILNSVGFMYRWSPQAHRLREMLAGRPRLFARTVVAWPIFDWVASGGVPKYLYSKARCGGPLIEQAIHFQDVLRYVTGDEPMRVEAMADLGRIAPLDSGRDCEETTAYLLRHESGMLSTHIHNWTHQGMLLQMQIVGQQFDLTWQMEGERRLFGAIDGKNISETSDADPYFEELVGFVEAVRRKDQGLIRSSYADATRSLQVCEAAARAVETGEGVVIG